jgi:hypothetical protein
MASPTAAFEQFAAFEHAAKRAALSVDDMIAR